MAILIGNMTTKQWIYGYTIFRRSHIPHIHLSGILLMRPLFQLGPLKQLGAMVTCPIQAGNVDGWLRQKDRSGIFSKDVIFVGDLV